MIETPQRSSMLELMSNNGIAMGKTRDGAIYCIQEELDQAIREFAGIPWIWGDDVARYLYEETDQEFWNYQKDFPNIAPPWPSFFMDFPSVAKIKSSVYGQIDSRQAKEWIYPQYGWWVRSADADERIEGARWYTRADLYIITTSGLRGEGEPVFHIGAFSWWTTNSGEMVSDERGLLLVWDSDEGSAFAAFERISSQQVQELARSYLNPLFLAISFSHCVNVDVGNSRLMPVRLHKKKRSKRVEFMVKTYTLDIRPMQKVLREEGHSEETGLKQALHICRGHFKDYRQRGLFGKNHGIYWWDMHARGSASQGVINKDYRVLSPETSN